MRELIVNADDFGLTPGVNRAVVELARAGWLTSATLMAAAVATEEAMWLARGQDSALALAQEPARAGQTPALGVGCHLVLVDGVSCLDAEAQGRYPWIGRGIEAGALPETPGRLLRALFAPGVSRGLREEWVEAEALAQIERLQAGGVRLTHVDTHKHLHQFPAILRPVLRAARRAGIGCIRNPFEAAWSRRATHGVPVARRAEFGALQGFRGAFDRMVAEAGFATTNGAVGVLATGTLDRGQVERLLAAMPEGRWELVTHPGYQDAALERVRTRLRASREVEMDALQAVAGAAGIRLTRFGGWTAG